MRLEPGLYAIEVVAGDTPAEAEGTLPIWLAQVPSDYPPDMLSADARGDQWLTGSDKIVAIRAPAGGAIVTATAFGTADQAPAAPELVVRQLEKGLPGIAAGPAPQPVIAAPQPAAAAPIASAVSRAEHEIPLEVTVHIERVGDRTFAGTTWAGRPGEQRRVEGFSIKSLQELQPSEVEYKALHPGGIETPWVPGPQFCGTRGQSLPITGLAIRIAPHVQDQFSVVYQAAFFRSGITEPRGNGAPCLPRVPGDALEGINIRIVQRRPG
ncbi:MAG TPA: hypothetical protein VM782_23945 [Stellaceae bacterium]|nr:hypothetical protein [Stellaceae bacterium]